MSAESVAAALVGLACVYFALGLVIGAFFVARGVERVDPGALGATLGFRLIVLPGIVALWPLFAFRWLAGGPGPPIERNAHRDAARRAGSAP